MRQNIRQRGNILIDRIREQIKIAYFKRDLSLLREILDTILALFHEAKVYKRRSRTEEQDSINKEIDLMFNLYSNVLGLISKVEKIKRCNV